MNASQNICSGFTDLSTDFSTSKIVDNVNNFVYNFIFSLFRHFSLWITFFLILFSLGFLWIIFYILVILYICHFLADVFLIARYENAAFWLPFSTMSHQKKGNYFCSSNISSFPAVFSPSTALFSTMLY